MAVFYNLAQAIKYQKPQPQVPNEQVLPGQIPGPSMQKPPIVYPPPSNVPKVGVLPTPGQTRGQRLSAFSSPMVRPWQQPSQQYPQPTRIVPRLWTMQQQSLPLKLGQQTSTFAGLANQIANPQNQVGGSIAGPRFNASIRTPLWQTKTSALQDGGQGGPYWPTSEWYQSAPIGYTEVKPPKIQPIGNTPWVNPSATGAIETKPFQYQQQYAPGQDTQSVQSAVYGNLPQSIQEAHQNIEEQKKNTLDLLDQEKGKALNQALAAFGARGALSSGARDALALAIEGQYSAKKAAMAAELDQQKIQNELAYTQQLGQLAESQGNLQLKDWAQQRQADLQQQAFDLQNQIAQFQQREAVLNDTMAMLYNMTQLDLKVTDEEVLATVLNALSGGYVWPMVAP